MATIGVLILDDDEKWVALHERRLREAGVQCHSTSLGDEAIKLGKSDSSIKFALIDEILYVPPVPLDERLRELQRWQGHDVVKEIARYRSDIQMFLVTSAPMIRSEGNAGLLLQESMRLRRQKGVTDIIYKEAIDANPEQEYGWLVEHILKRSPGDSTQAYELPHVFIALGFNSETYKRMETQWQELVEDKKSTHDWALFSRRREWLPVRPFISSGTDLLDDFSQSAVRCAIVVEAPASKRLDFGMSIKPESSAFRILWLLAKRTELRQDVVVTESDYDFKARTKKYKDSGTHRVETTYEGDSLSIFDEEVSDAARRVRSSPAREVASSHSSEKRALNGFQVERHNRQKESPLKVAIHRLSQQLSRLNVGPARHLFSTIPERGYRPAFQINIALVLADRLKKRKR